MVRSHSCYHPLRVLFACVVAYFMFVCFIAWFSTNYFWAFVSSIIFELFSVWFWTCGYAVFVWLICCIVLCVAYLILCCLSFILYPLLCACACACVCACTTPSVVTPTTYVYVCVCLMICQSPWLDAHITKIKEKTKTNVLINVTRQSHNACKRRELCQDEMLVICHVKR